MRGVTGGCIGHGMDEEISTHTPHARRDDTVAVENEYGINFYSHASCEA